MISAASCQCGEAKLVVVTAGLFHFSESGARASFGSAMLFKNRVLLRLRRPAGGVYVHAKEGALLSVLLQVPTPYPVIPAIWGLVPGQKA